MKNPFEKNQNIEGETVNKRERLKRILFIGLIIIIILISISNKILSERSKGLELSETPQRIENASRLPREPQGVVYILNRINRVNNIIEYTWNKDTLAYVTNSGIYLAGSNTSLDNGNISYADANGNGFFLYNKDENWFVYNLSASIVSPISIRGSSPKINKSGGLVTSISEGNLVITDLEGGESVIETEGVTTKAEWAYEKNLIATEINTGNEKIVRVFSKNGSNKAQITIPKSSEFAGISPNGSSLGIVNGNKFLIKTIDNDKDIEFVFDIKNTLSGNWITNNDFILLETTFIEAGERNTIWKISREGKKTYLATDDPIPNKVNTLVRHKINNSLNTIPIVEKEESLWLLGLIPNQSPYYSSGSTIFQEIPRSLLQQSHP